MQRHIFGVTTTMLGSLDPESDEAVANACVAVRGLVALVLGHTRFEETYIHPLFEAAAPDVAAFFDAQHIEFDHRFARLEDRVAALESVEMVDRSTAAGDLYDEFVTILASYYEHMELEEQRAAPILQKNMTKRQSSTLNSH